MEILQKSCVILYIIYYILYIIYVNSQIKDETALGKLMHDFSCTNAKDMYYEVLADRVHYFKEDEKGVWR